MKRSDVVATVGGLSAVGGMITGAATALVAAAVLTPSEPVTASQIAMMAVENGAMLGVVGAVLGTAVAFGALRRVPLGRLLLCTNAGAAAGLLAGWLGGPWAWHHFNLLGFAGFSIGALVARALASNSPKSSAVPVSGPDRESATLTPDVHARIPAPTAASSNARDQIALRVTRDE